MTQRYRITVRGLGLDLRGFMDQRLDEDQPTLTDLADAMKPFGLVMASPMEGKPFEGQPSMEQSIDVVQGVVASADDLVAAIEGMAMLHYGQAMVIRGERDEREEGIRLMHERELHHFEVEQENAALREEIRTMRTSNG